MYMSGTTKRTKGSSAAVGRREGGGRERGRSPAGEGAEVKSINSSFSWKDGMGFPVGTAGSRSKWYTVKGT